MHSDCRQRGRDPSSTETPPTDAPGGRPLEGEMGEVGAVGAERLDGCSAPGPVSGAGPAARGAVCGWPRWPSTSGQEATAVTTVGESGLHGACGHRDAGSELDDDAGKGREGARVHSRPGLGAHPMAAGRRPCAGAALCGRAAPRVLLTSPRSSRAGRGLLSFGETQIVWGAVSLRAQANAEWRMDGCRPGAPVRCPSGDRARDQQPRSPPWSSPRRPERSLSHQNLPARFHGRKQCQFWKAEFTLGQGPRVAPGDGRPPCPWPAAARRLAS